MIASRLVVASVAALIGWVGSGERPDVPLAYPTDQATVADDTLRYSVRAGQTLIVSLPSRVGGTEARYEIRQAPALSWLVDRSFMWRTLERERGTLPIRLDRRIGDRPPESLVLLVEITA